MMVLFGGGDGGGIYIDAKGVLHRIPPWTPDLMAQLKAVNALTSAAGRVKAPEIGKEMHGLAERLASGVIPRLAQSVGGIGAGENTVAFFDGDDGFFCGSTGKRPIPFPIPHGGIRDLAALGASVATDAGAPQGLPV